MLQRNILVVYLSFQPLPEVSTFIRYFILIDVIIVYKHIL